MLRKKWKKMSKGEKVQYKIKSDADRKRFEKQKR